LGQEVGERAGGEESFWAAGKKNWDAGWAGTKKRKRAAGRVSGPRGKSKRKALFIFLKQIKLFQIKFKLKDLNLS